VVIGDDELDAVQAAGPQRFQKLFPARSALPVGELDRKHLAPAFLVDPDRDQHRLARNDAIVPDALVAGIQDQIRERLLELAIAKGLQRGIEPLVGRADRRGRGGMAPSSSVTCLTFRVETRCTYISASAATAVSSERW